MKKTKTYFVHDKKNWLRVESFTPNAAAGEFREYYDEHIAPVTAVELVSGIDDINKFLIDRIGSLAYADIYVELLIVIIKHGPTHPNYVFAAQAFVHHQNTHEKIILA